MESSPALSWLSAADVKNARRAHITPRFVRHFNVIGYVDMSDDDKRLIFRTILDNFLSSGFDDNLPR